MKKKRLFSRIFAEDLGNGHLQNRSGSEPQRNHKKAFGTKMKRLFSGFLAAFLCLIVVFAPLSTAIVVEGEGEGETSGTGESGTGKIIIKNPAEGGTYTAYPIFKGEVEWDYDTKKLLISDIQFHNNLETQKSKSSNAIETRDDTSNYALCDYISSSMNTSINYFDTEKSFTFKELIDKYDPNNALANLSLNFNGIDRKKQAEELAKILNLSSEKNKDSIQNVLTGDSSTSAFYPAFAEAARICMGTDRELVSYKGVSTDSDAVEITGLPDGYYVVEWTPGKSGDETTTTNINSLTPWGVTRALVLVGHDEKHPAEINSKDTKNIASVDVKFYDKAADVSMVEVNNENSTIIFKDGAFPADGNWKKTVSMGDGAYVKCRIEVTLPSNLSVYDQYYLAVPIMYNYNGEGKSIIRKATPKVYICQTDENANPIEITGVFDTDNCKIDSSFIYANDSGTANPATPDDNFKANEAFVINDLLSLEVEDSKSIKDKINSGSFYDKLVFEFPIQFIRSGYTEKDFYSKPFIGYMSENKTTDDYLLKNYITVKAVYSNNPNLHLAEESSDSGTSTDIDELSLNTSKNLGSLQNPVSYTQPDSANIVTYRLRFRATKDDINNNSCGIGGVKFALKKTDEKNNIYYAVLKKIVVDNLAISSYDKVTKSEDDSFEEFTGTDVKVNLYQITEWKMPNELSIDSKESETISETTLPDEVILSTYTNIESPSDKGTYDIANSGRFEIVGLEPGTYTLVALDESIKAKEKDGTANTLKDYKLKKNEFEFKFDPTLNDAECKKLSYATKISPTISNEIISTLGFEATDTAVGTNKNVALMSMEVKYIEKGIPLPVTGGIGTFIFYAVGGVIVLLSTVALITKFRIKRERL